MGDTHESEKENGHGPEETRNIGDGKGGKYFRSTPCRLGCSKWCSKYFWEGI